MRIGRNGEHGSPRAEETLMLLQSPNAVAMRITIGEDIVDLDVGVCRMLALLQRRVAVRQ